MCPFAGCPLPHTKTSVTDRLPPLRLENTTLSDRLAVRGTINIAIITTSVHHNAWHIRMQPLESLDTGTVAIKQIC